MKGVLEQAKHVQRLLTLYIVRQRKSKIYFSSFHCEKRARERE